MYLKSIKAYGFKNGDEIIEHSDHSFTVAINGITKKYDQKGTPIQE